MMQPSGSSKPQRGDKVVLVRGTGAKRKYNGLQAVVAAYPKKGGWMTVHLQSDDGGTQHQHKKLKWRKRGYSTSPVELLDESLLVNILSFLEGRRAKETDSSTIEDEDTVIDARDLLWVKDAAKIHTKLALVCCSWRKLCDRNLSSILGPLDANLDALALHTVVPCVLWMSKHNLKLGSIRAKATLADIPLLIKLLRICDTSQLINVNAHVGGSATDESLPMRQPDSSPWIAQAYQASISPPAERMVINLTNDRVPSFAHLNESMATALGIPYGHLTQKHFHDVLAEQCPNIKKLAATVTFIVNQERTSWYTDYISSTLFSKSSIQQLELSLCWVRPSRDYPAYEWPIDGMLVTKIIQNLSGLRELSLKIPKRLFYNRRFHVKSPSLQKLDVTGVGKCVWISCDCPRLRLFRYFGANPYGSGAVPIFNQEQWQNMESFEEEYLHQTDRSRYSRPLVLRVPAGIVPFTGLSVPDDCLCIVEEYERPTDFIMQQINEARFTTW